MTTATKITLLRVVMIPAYMLFMYLSGGEPGLWMWLGLGVFILASITDYIDGYLEIELELFGLNIDSFDKDEYLRKRRIKLGVPKDILGFFQYNHGRYNNNITITSIVESMNINPSEYQEDHFFMGRDGIYFRII